MIYGAVLAGGIGKRMEKSQIPKQFIQIGGTPILIMTLRKFLEIPDFKVIYVAMHKDWISSAQKLFDTYFSESEIQHLRLIEGGKERIDSLIHVMNDIIANAEITEHDIIICHDGVRPFVTEQMIRDCISETQNHKVSLTVTPAEDTVYISHREGYIDGTLDRNCLYKGQTPSGFQLSLLKSICDTVSEGEKSQITGTTQLMIHRGLNLKIVKGSPSNFKITTDSDLDVADRVVRAKKRKGSIILLDCTLRDGGIVIDFQFGQKNINKIRQTLEDAGVSIIECGYIDEKKGIPNDLTRTCFCDETVITESMLKERKKSSVLYVAMIDYGTYDLSKLMFRNSSSIDGIRFAFHKEHWKEALDDAQKIIEKGYKLYIQPMVSMRYEDDEFRNMIWTINETLPQAEAFYLVDSFGQMDNIDLLHKAEITDELLSSKIKIGFHAHNNRQLAYSNALAFINYPFKHDIILDSTIMGMGKGAGNLCTELIMESLLKMGMTFQTNGILKMIAEYFTPLKEEYHWGYSLEYYLAAVFGCTPSYVKIFMKDERVTTDILKDLLQNMPFSKRAACDKKFAAEYLSTYFK